MRWLNFLILVFVVLLLQVAVCRPLGLGPQRIMPDLLLMTAVILSFHGSGDKVPVACWVLGLVKDVSSQGALGCYAFSFGLLALIIIRLRDMFYGDKPLVLMLFIVVGGFLAEQMTLLIGMIKEDFPSETYGALSMAAMFSVLFTAGLAPYGQWLMMKLHRQLGLPRRRAYK